MMGANVPEYCNHPELRPTQWNQPRPKPTEMIKCACGMNATCPVCGWGRSCYPCECDRRRVVARDSSEPIFGANVREAITIVKDWRQFKS